MIIMSKRRKPSQLFHTSRVMGRQLGKIVIESKAKSRIIARKGRSGLETTADNIGKAGRKAQKKARTVTQETIPQIVREFRRGLKEGMKKK